MSAGPVRRCVAGAARRRLAVALALAATALVTPHAGAAGCDAVSTSGRWSVVTLPGLSAIDTAIAFGARGARDTLYAFSRDLNGGNSKQGVARTLFRSRDGGCTWSALVSLDSLGAATDAYRADPAYRFLAVAVSQGPPGKRRVYALAGDDGYSLGVALPTTTFVSTDDGAHWTVHQPSAVDLAGDYPRCSNDGWASTRLFVGTDPSTVSLRCRAATLGEGYMLAECAEAFYVSHDAARTWTPVRGRLRDVAGATTDNGLGCDSLVAPAVSAVTPRTVWDYTYYGGATRIYVSHDDGKTLTQVAQTPVTVACGCGFDVLERAKPRPLVATWDTKDVYVSTGAPVMQKLPRPVPTTGALGVIAAAAFLPGAGHPRLLVAYDVEKPTASEAFLYDVTARTWTPVRPRPARANKSPAWQEFDATDTRSVPDLPTVYVVTSDGVLVRYAG